MTSFVFVTEGKPRGPKPSTIRTAIRKQAMRDVAASRKGTSKSLWRTITVYPDLGYGTSNGNSSEDTDDPKVEPIIEIVTPDAEEDRLGRGAVEQHGLQLLMIKPSAQGLQRIRDKFDIDLPALSILASAHVGRATGPCLSRESQTVGYLLSQKATYWSYLSMLATMQQPSQLILDAATCLSLRARNALGPHASGYGSEAQMSYLRVLKALQHALNEPDSASQSDVLCAINMLALAELLENKVEAWANHLAGAALLMQHRGAASFRSELDHALLASIAGPFKTEALFGNTHCFLEHHSWADALKSAADPPQRKLAAALHAIGNTIPGYFADVTVLLCHSKQKPSQDKLDALCHRIGRTRLQLLLWHCDCEELLRVARANAMARPSALALLETDQLEEAFAAYCSLSIVINRLLVALDTTRASELEGKTQQLALQVLSDEGTTPAGRPLKYLFWLQKSVVSRAALETSYEWRNAACNDHSHWTVGPNLIPQAVFERFCALIGRKTN